MKNNLYYPKDIKEYLNKHIKKIRQDKTLNKVERINKITKVFKRMLGLIKEMPHA